jgi:hypothetical protein
MVLSAVVLGFHWFVGDSEVRTKIIVTLVWLALWGLLFVNGWVLTAAQGIFSLVVGVMTFGADWLSRR